MFLCPASGPRNGRMRHFIIIIDSELTGGGRLSEGIGTTVARCPVSLPGALGAERIARTRGRRGCRGPSSTASGGSPGTKPSPALLQGTEGTHGSLTHERAGRQAWGGSQQPDIRKQVLTLKAV